MMQLDNNNFFKLVFPLLKQQLLLSIVCLNMHFKSVLLPEYFTALQTLERLLVRVDLHVSFLRSQSGKGFRTR